MTRSVCVTAASLFLATSVLVAGWQSPQTPPVFRGGTTIVPLTVTVLDKEGNPVTDLTQADFTVLENKVRQDLRSFFPQPMTARSVEDTGARVVRGATPDPLVPATRRTFLLVLGADRIQAPGKAIDGAIKFVREHLLPQDLVAVMAFNRATEFNSNHAEVVQTLERYKRAHEKIFFEIREFRIRHPGMALPESFQRDMDAVFEGVPIRSAADLLLGMDGVTKLNEPGWNRQMTVGEVLEGTSRSSRKLSEQMIGSPLLKVYAGIGYLRGLEGKKHLVWLGRVLTQPSAEADERLAARANDAHVTIDIIHTTGVQGFFWASSPQTIAGYTGGQYSGNIYADQALARVDARSRFSYLLGYAPSNPTLDGKYRDINVQVNRRDVTVVFQHGYYATAEPSPVELRELVTSSRLSAAGMSDEAAHGISVTATASPVVVFGRTEMKVDLVIDRRNLSFTETSGGRVATLDVQVFCGDAESKLVGQNQRRFDVTIDEETFARSTQDPLKFSMRAPVGGKVKHVKVVVYEFATDLLGTVMLTLKNLDR